MDRCAAAIAASIVLATAFPAPPDATYTDADFRLGLNAAQTTLGAIGRLSGATVAP